jgi:hypothetical protein
MIRQNGKFTRKTNRASKQPLTNTNQRMQTHPNKQNPDNPFMEDPMANEEHIY